MSTFKSAAEWDAQEREILEMIRRSDEDVANERHNRRVLFAAFILACSTPAYVLVSNLMNLASLDRMQVASAPAPMQKALTTASTSVGCPSEKESQR